MTTELDTFILCHLFIHHLKVNMCLCNANRDIRSLHILQYKDGGVPSEPLTRQSNTARDAGF